MSNPDFVRSAASRILDQVGSPTETLPGVGEVGGAPRAFGVVRAHLAAAIRAAAGLGGAPPGEVPALPVRDGAGSWRMIPIWPGGNPLSGAHGGQEVPVIVGDELRFGEVRVGHRGLKYFGWPSCDGGLVPLRMPDGTVGVAPVDSRRERVAVEESRSLGVSAPDGSCVSTIVEAVRDALRREAVPGARP